MDRLSNFLTLLTGAVLTGSLVIIAFSFGWYGWLPVLASAAVGFALSWPVAYAISRRIKRKDPGWDESVARDYEGKPPKPSSPEV